MGAACSARRNSSEAPPPVAPPPARLPLFPVSACLPASLLYLPFWCALPVLHPLPACLSDPACPQFFPDVYEAKYGPNAAANTDPYWWAPRGIGPTQPMHAAMMGVAG